MRNDFRDSFVEKMLKGESEAILESRVFSNGVEADIVLKKDPQKDYKIFILEKDKHGKYCNEVSSFEITIDGINAAYAELDLIEEAILMFR